MLSDHDEEYLNFELHHCGGINYAGSPKMFKGMKCDRDNIVTSVLVPSGNNDCDSYLVWVSPEDIDQVLNFIRTLGGVK